MYSNKILMIIISSLLILSCSKDEKPEFNKELNIKMNRIAEEYVKLVLNIGQFDPDYVDAYYGPEEWKPEEESEEYDSAKVQNLYDKGGELLDSLELLNNERANDIQVLRYKFLYKQIMAARTFLFRLAGGELTFDEETKALYDAKAPVFSNDHFQVILDKLDNILPENGNNLSERLIDFKKSFIIPKEKLSEVFNTAIEEGRKRTLQYIELPDSENFNVEYVNDKPWGAYNWYKGNSFSVIQINTDLPIYIDRAVDLACHEGYPGHHVYSTLLENKLYKELGWVEFSVYALFSPQSFIAEGTAQYGIEVAFPGRSRIKFEKEVLFPIAGLNPEYADKYYDVLELTDQLDYATNEAARNYLNGNWNKKETKEWLIKYSLRSPAGADKMISFIEKYRSYVINYNLGKDVVANYIERLGGISDNPELRWKLFKHILSTPQTASNLQKRQVY